MPKVVIPRGELNEIDLPPVCVVTGATEGVRFVPWRFRTLSPWWILLAPLCCVPFGVVVVPVAWIVIFFVGSGGARGALPLSRAGETRVWRARGAWLGLIALAVATFGFLVEKPPPATTPALIAVVAGGLLIWFAFVTLIAIWDRDRVIVSQVSRDAVTLRVRSDDAVAAIERRLYRWNGGWTDSWCTRRATDAHACPNHPEHTAGWICGRCGGFACDDCLRHVRPDAMPLCTGCFARRPA